MCSVDPDEIVEMTRATDGLDLSSGNVTCRRCNTEKAVVVLRMKDAYCRECFLSYFVHKFRSTIGKSKQIRPGDQILIATSGGVSSSALLHLVREGLDEASHKKLRFEPACLYIDESCLGDSPNIGPEFVQQVCNRVLSGKFPCYVISLEQIMSSKPPVPTLYTEDGSVELSTSLELKEQIQKLFSSCKTVSAKQDLLEQLRRELLYQCASALSYQKIFLGDNATALSVSILSNVALGRGSQLSDRVHFKARHKDIEIYRPMRELLQDEIHYYNDLHDIATVQAPSFKHKDSSIISCTEQFVMGLQKEFPATVPTIFRTGDKLVSTTEMSKCSTPELNDYNYTNFSPSMLCAMCGLQLDTLQSESSAVHATLVSQRLSCIVAPTAKQEERLAESTNCSYETSPTTSSLPPWQNCNDTEKSNNGYTELSDGVGTNSLDCSQQTRCCSSNKDKALSDGNNSVPKDILDGYLCYGCRIIVRELEEVNRLPIKVRGSVAEQERRKHMRDQIQDYLL